MPFIRTKDGSISIIRKAEVFSNNTVHIKKCESHDDPRSLLYKEQHNHPNQLGNFIGFCAKSRRRSLSGSTYVNIIGCMTFKASCRRSGISNFQLVYLGTDKCPGS